MERRLAAILAADVFGYSRLMGEDEEATLRTLSAYRKIIDSLIDSHRGRFVNSAGDLAPKEGTHTTEPPHYLCQSVAITIINRSFREIIAPEVRKLGGASTAEAICM
jgi:hypothetical protein